MPAAAGEEAHIETKEPAHRERAWIIAAVIALLLLLWLIWANMVVVPDLVGHDEADAIQATLDVGLRVGGVGTARTDSAIAGMVVKQKPAGGKRVLPFWPVDIVVARGALVPPDGVDVRTGDFEPPGFEDDGEEGEEGVPPGAAGPRTVPSVHGMARDSAVRSLRRQGYKPVVRRGPSTTTVPRGHVYFQSPGPHEDAEGVFTVEIWISNGPPAPRSFPYAQPSPEIGQ